MPADLERDLLLGDVRYRNMGLIGNPFLRYELDDPIGVGLVSHAQACALVSALEVESLEDRPRPVWVDKAVTVAEYYHTVAVSETLRSLAREETPLLGLYIVLDEFRLGRFRGALGAVADAVGARQFDRTLAAWAADVLADVDTELEEYASVASMDLPAVIERLQTTPSETIAEYFGEYRYERQNEADADLRQAAVYTTEEHLDRDPTEDDGTDETDAALLAAAPPDISIVTPAAADDPEALADSELEEPEEQPKEDLAAYLIAYARAHVSPVVARALHGYIVGGASAVIEQLLLTKAPKKTLKALIAFATHRYRKVVLIYDRFDPWPEIDEDGRALILGTMSELRWLLADHGMLVLLVSEDLAEELREQFGGAKKVSWDLRNLAEMGVKDPPLDLDLVQSWVDAASLGDEPVFAVEGPEFAPIVDAAGGRLDPFATMAAAAVDDAANRGVSTLDTAAIEAGLKVMEAE